MKEEKRITAESAVPPLGVTEGTINIVELVAKELSRILEERGFLKDATIKDWMWWGGIISAIGECMTNITEVKFTYHAGGFIASNRAKLSITPRGQRLEGHPVERMVCVLETQLRSDTQAKSMTGKVVDVSTIDGVKEILIAVAQL